MNKWVQKSTNLAKSNFYLDNLLKIYPPHEISRELILEEESSNFKNLFERKDCKQLIKELLRLKDMGFKFPIENPYISFLSYYKDAIEKNPKTVNQICDQLLKLDYNQLKKKLEAPKKASRRIGPMFRNWLKEKFAFLDIREFKEADKIVFLEGGDKVLKEYAEKRLQCVFGELSKGLDFIAKAQTNYIIGTAKFITAFGGTQDNQFNDAIRLIKDTRCPPEVTKIAIIDGVAWLGGRMKFTLDSLRDDQLALSALLLQKYLNEICSK